MRVILTCLLTILIVLPIFSQTTTIYPMRTTNFYNSFTTGTAGFFNQSDYQVGMYANGGGTKQVALWRKFRTNADGTGSSDRSMQVGDQFIVTISTVRAYGQVGFALLASPSLTPNWSERENNYAIAFNLEGPGYTSGSWDPWYIKSNSGNKTSSTLSGVQDVYTNFTFTLTLIAPDRMNVAISNGTTTENFYDIELNTSNPITDYSIYLEDDWDGDSNENVYWGHGTEGNQHNLTNTGLVTIGESNNSFTISTAISDGLVSNSSSTPWTNRLTKTGSGTVTLSGTNTYLGATNINAGTLQIAANNTIGELSIASGANLSVDNSITFTVTETLTLNEDETIGAGIVSLGTTGEIDESQGRLIGILQDTEPLAKGVNETFGNIGVQIQTDGDGSDPGNTIVTRVTGTAISAGGGNSIERYFDITPNTNTGLNADFVFHYSDDELNGITETNLTLFKSIDGGSTWTDEGGSVNTTNNTVTLTGVDGFSRWTLGDKNSPLPVELTSFTATTTDAGVELNWQTITEVNNYGFEVERASTSLGNQELEWETLGFVEGSGNSNSPKSYSFVDANAPTGELSYRLKQIDTDGSYEYFSTTASVSNGVTSVNENILPTEYSLNQNFPNPFNPSTQISFALPENGQVDLRVFNSLGQEVAVLANNIYAAGNHIVNFDASNLTTGLYYYRLVSNEFVSTKKMLMIK
jgi:autotransporter-associated beta strand protein